MENTTNLNIAGYCRISVDMELDRDNTSIEHQKAIIAEFVKTRFPEATLTFYEDRDRSGYTFDQREGYQRMRKKLMSGKENPTDMEKLLVELCDADGDFTDRAAITELVEYAKEQA